MKIKNIKVYKIDIPLKEGSYKWAHNNHVEKFDTSIVMLETDNNITGLGGLYSRIILFTCIF